MSGETIYVVLGSTGEYSDRYEWLVRAFRREIDAQSFVEFLTAERAKLGPTTGIGWERRGTVEVAMKKHDPSFSEDYTGTSWWVESVELAQ